MGCGGGGGGSEGAYHPEGPSSSRRGKTEKPDGDGVGGRGGRAGRTGWVETEGRGSFRVWSQGKEEYSTPAVLRTRVWARGVNCQSGEVRESPVRMFEEDREVSGPPPSLPGFTCDDGRVVLSALRLHPQLQGELLPRDCGQRLRPHRQLLPAAREVQGRQRPLPERVRHLRLPAPLPLPPAPTPAVRLALRLFSSSPGSPRSPAPRGCSSESPVRGGTLRVQPVRVMRRGGAAARSLHPAP